MALLFHPSTPSYIILKQNPSNSLCGSVVFFHKAPKTSGCSGQNHIFGSSLILPAVPRLLEPARETTCNDQPPNGKPSWTDRAATAHTVYSPSTSPHAICEPKTTNGHWSTKKFAIRNKCTATRTSALLVVTRFATRTIRSYLNYYSIVASLSRFGDFPRTAVGRLRPTAPSPGDPLPSRARRPVRGVPASTALVCFGARIETDMDLDCQTSSVAWWVEIASWRH